MHRLSFMLLLIATLPAFAQPPVATPAIGSRISTSSIPTTRTPSSRSSSTPQWVGEPDVDAVVVLAIDDMRDPKKYETFLRPILNRLKKIDGRAPVSIMTLQCRSAGPADCKAGSRRA